MKELLPEGIVAEMTRWRDEQIRMQVVAAHSSGEARVALYRIKKRARRQQGISAPHALLVTCMWPRLCQLCSIGYGCQPRSSC